MRRQVAQRGDEMRRKLRIGLLWQVARDVRRGGVKLGSAAHTLLAIVIQRLAGQLNTQVCTESVKTSKRYVR
jgi:hypothetical protein